MDLSRKQASRAAPTLRPRFATAYAKSTSAVRLRFKGAEFSIIPALPPSSARFPLLSSLLVLAGIHPKDLKMDARCHMLGMTHFSVIPAGIKRGSIRKDLEMDAR
jgi:hypothetical protein